MVKKMIYIINDLLLAINHFFLSTVVLPNSSIDHLYYFIGPIINYNQLKIYNDKQLNNYK